MRMLRQMRDHIRKNRIHNDNIQDSSVTLIDKNDDKIG